jgi:hypothetical protein
LAELFGQLTLQLPFDQWLKSSLEQIALAMMAMLPLDDNPATGYGGLSSASPSAPPLRGYGVSIN